MGQMLQCIPRKVLPAGQDECPAREDFKFPVDRDGIHPESLGKATRIYHNLSSSWDGRMAHPPKLLQWANDDMKGLYRCCYSRSLSRHDHHKSQGFGRENGLQPGVERRTTPTLDEGQAYHQGDGYDCREAGPPDQEIGRREPTIDPGSRLRHGFALHVRSLWE